MRAIMSIVGLLLLTSAAMAAEKSPLSEKAASAGKDADALVAIGHLYIEAMNLKKAKQSFKQAKWKDMDNPEARLGLIRIQIANQNFRPAKGACRKLERSHPKNSAGAVCSGYYWMANRRSSRAVEEFEKAAALGDAVRAKTGLGDAAMLQAKWDDAVKHYKEALAAGAGYQAHMGLGLALERKGDKAGAVAALKNAVTAEPASCLARYHLGRVLEKGDEAVTQLKTALAIRPDWIDALLVLGDAYSKAGDFDNASKTFELATKIDPKRAEAFMGLGTSLYKLGKLDEALTALNRQAALVPNHVDTYLLTAEIQFAKNNVDAAIEALDRARGVAANDVGVLIRAAEIYYHAKRFTNASVYLNQALSLKPKMSKAHAMLGEISCSRRLYDEGRKHYSKAIKGDLKGVEKTALEKKRAACKK